MSLGRESFPRRARLTRRFEFLNVSRGGRKVHSPHFVIISKANDQGENRLGIIVSAKVGKAVVRSWVKRCLREFFRRFRYELPSPRDYVIVAKKGAGDLAFDQLAEELKMVFAHRRSRQR